MMRRIIKVSAFCLFILICHTVWSKNGLFETNPYAVLKGYNRVRALNGKKGELLGYIYVKNNLNYTNGVLTDLLVVKANNNKLDTLYRIDSKGFFNSQGKPELKNTVKQYYGFKLSKELKGHTDLFSVGDVDRNGKLFSDDNDFLINWNYQTKRFEYYPMP